MNDKQRKRLSRWFERNKKYIVPPLGIFFGINLVLNGLIFTHLFVYELSIYEPDAFESVSTWALVIDTVVWSTLLFVLYWYELRIPRGEPSV